MKVKSPRRPWWFHIAVGIGALVVGSVIVLMAITMFFLLVYGW